MNRRRIDVMTKLFTRPDTWHGGYYELALEFGPHSEEHIDAAVRALWNCPELHGCYLVMAKEPAEEERVSPSFGLLEQGHLYGIATLPNGKQAACGTCLVRDPDGPWLLFYVPLGSLSTAYEVGS